MTIRSPFYDEQNIAQKSFAAHVLGISIVLLLATFPVEVPRAKVINGFPLHISLFSLLYCAFSLKAKVSKNFKIVLLMVVLIFALSSVRVVYSSENISIGLSEINTLLLAWLVSISLVKCNLHNLKLVYRYVSFTLLVSSITSLLFWSNIIKPDSESNILRNVDVANLDFTSTRVVIPTLFLAIAYCVVSFAYFGITGKSSNKLHKLTFISSCVIVVLAQSRLVLICVFTLFIFLILFRFVRNIIRLFLVTIITGSVAILVVFTFTSTVTDNDFAKSSISSSISRVIAGFQTLSDTGSDPSIIYRNKEDELVLAAIKENVVDGLGFGVPYSAYSLSKGNGWLSVFGRYYNHNSIYWLCLRFGVPISLVILMFIFYTLRPSKRFSSKSQLVIQLSGISILSVSPFWNLFAGFSESLVLLSLLGLSQNDIFKRNYDQPQLFRA